MTLPAIASKLAPRLVRVHPWVIVRDPYSLMVSQTIAQYEQWPQNQRRTREGTT
jgi:hypothetical protein